jgi:acetylornithine deacetylase/succinyl-diaminopimelate desuccinylase-like protein
MRNRWRHACIGVLLVLACADLRGQAQGRARAESVEDEALRHFQAILRLDTQNPPGNEVRVVDYLKRVFDAEGIPVEILARDPARPNLVARLKGSGAKRPLLLMGHTDTVTVDASKWTHGPFSAAREGG